MRYSLYNEIFHLNFETTSCLEVKNKNIWIILQDFFLVLLLQQQKTKNFFNVYLNCVLVLCESL